MAAFATMELAEARALAKGPAGDMTWLEAYAAVTMAGAFCVRVQRYMSPTNPAYGEWVEIEDDGTV